MLDHTGHEEGAGEGIEEGSDGDWDTGADAGGWGVFVEAGDVGLVDGEVELEDVGSGLVPLDSRRETTSHVP